MPNHCITADKLEGAWRDCGVEENIESKQLYGLLKCIGGILLMGPLISKMFDLSRGLTFAIQARMP